jgi:hypothetical protein
LKDMIMASMKRKNEKDEKKRELLTMKIIEM